MKAVHYALPAWRRREDRLNDQLLLNWLILFLSVTDTSLSYIGLEAGVPLDPVIKINSGKKLISPNQGFDLIAMLPVFVMPGINHGTARIPVKGPASGTIESQENNSTLLYKVRK